MKQNDINDNNVRVLNSYNYAQGFNVYQDQDGFYYYNLLKNVTFPENIASNLFTLVRPRPQELLPQFSYRVYDVVDLWWLIAKVNNIDNPLETLNPEIPLKVIIPGNIPLIINSLVGS